MEKDEEHRGWKLTEEGFEKLEDVVDEFMEDIDILQTDNIQDNYNVMEQALRKVMDSCFITKKPSKKDDGVKYCPKYIELSKKINMLSRQGKQQRELARKYREKVLKLNEEAVAEIQATALEKIIQQITTNGKFSTQGFWKLRKATNNKTPQCTSVFNQDGKEVFDAEGIKKAFEEEFRTRVSPRSIDPGYESIQIKTELLCKMILDKCAVVKEDLFTLEEYIEVKSRLKKGKATGMDKIPAELYMHGGETLDEKVCNMLNAIKDAAIMPKQWNEVGISPIYKN
jgi:hypothetical protein